MKEKLYTIPVTDAFNSDCECPICTMYNTLEADAINYTMGPSYMEEDIRAQTDKAGFCQKHVKMLYEKQNTLGMALILKTHLDKTNKDLKKLMSTSKVSGQSLFKKSPQLSPVSEYIKQLESSCFVCNRVDNTFDRYLVTIIYLFKTEDSFKDVLKKSKGFCTKHYEALYSEALKNLSGNVLNDFIQLINTLYIDNMERVAEDVGWLINKFDYRYENEPWKNAKDAIPRTLVKTNGIML